MYKHINRDIRIALGAFLRDGYTQQGAAEALGIHPSTVSRELKRNPNKDGYHATHADGLSKQRRKESKSAYRIIEHTTFLPEIIASMLHPLVSPEVVGHELGIHHQTIYSWIYRTRPDLKQKLPYRGKKRRRYGTKRQTKQGWTRDVHSIEERPGDMPGFEGDTVKGATRAQLLTHVERRSLFTIADLIRSGEADVVHAHMKGRPQFLGHTVTYDRGSEFALWRMIEKDTGSKIYFAHPHHPWERGKNENTNGRLRRVYPKGFNFDTITQKDIDRTVWLMNHTKRKSLNWRTPCRLFGKCCTSG